MNVQAAGWRGFQLDYGSELEGEIKVLAAAIEAQPDLAARFEPRWLALKLLEQDKDILQKVIGLAGGGVVLPVAAQCADRLGHKFGEDIDTLIADRRYSWINQVVHGAVQRRSASPLSLTDHIDRVVTNRLVGIPIFLFAMWATLKITADVSAPYLDWIGAVISGPITRWVVALLSWLGLGGSWVESLLVDGALAGVGGVLVFVPVLMALYFVLAVLEDSGYMARAAFVMDRLMSALGLHGKSFLPMLVGFGCTVPAIYATRTLENKQDRVLTALLVPFMSCGARLPVYLLFAAIFFPQSSGSIVFAMYLLGILTAIGVGAVLKRAVFKGKPESAFVMELPPYRMPTLKGIWFHVWENTSGFLRKAGGVILLMSLILWLLMAIPLSGRARFAQADIDDSLFAGVARVSTPVLKPLGFGGWEAGGALFTGFVAKEVVVSTLAQIYDVEASQPAVAAISFGQDLMEIGSGFMKATADTLRAIPLVIGVDLREQAADEPMSDLMVAIRGGFDHLSGGHGALAGLAFIIFVLLYTPCMSAVTAQRQEFGSGVMWASVVGQTGLAWLIALSVFQLGVLLGLG